MQSAWLNLFTQVSQQLTVSKVIIRLNHFSGRKRNKKTQEIRGCSDTHKSVLKFVVCILFPSMKDVTHTFTVFVIVVFAYACKHSQVVCLSVEGDVVQVHVEVRVVLTAHPADGSAVEGGA